MAEHCESLQGWALLSLASRGRWFCFEGASLSSRCPGLLLVGKQEARRARRWQQGSHPASALRSCLVLPWACARGALTHDAPREDRPFCDTRPCVRIVGTIGTPEGYSRQSRSRCPVRWARCRRTSTMGPHICNPKGAGHTETERRTEDTWVRRSQVSAKWNEFWRAMLQHGEYN